MAELPAPRARFQVYVGPTRCFWRLLGRNNRAYARSVETPGPTSVEQVRDLALLAARAAADGRVDLMSTRGREWEWVLTVDDVAVARSNGTYGRRVECLASVERFRQVAPGAPVTYVRLAHRELSRGPVTPLAPVSPVTPLVPIARSRPGSPSPTG